MRGHRSRGCASMGTTSLSNLLPSLDLFCGENDALTSYNLLDRRREAGLQTKQFFREATGLVREYGAIDTLLFASVFVFALVFTITQFPWFYGNTAGADLPTSLVVAAIPFIFLMLAYWAIA